MCFFSRFFHTLHVRQAKGKASKSTVNDTAENKAGKALRDAAVQNKMLSTKMPTDAAVSKPSKGNDCVLEYNICRNIRTHDLLILVFHDRNSDL